MSLEVEVKASKVVRELDSQTATLLGYAVKINASEKPLSDLQREMLQGMSKVDSLIKKVLAFYGDAELPPEFYGVSDNVHE